MKIERAKVLVVYIFPFDRAKFPFAPGFANVQRSDSLQLMGADVTQSQYLMSPSQPQVTTLDVS